jgi:hypothetical protein
MKRVRPRCLIAAAALAAAPAFGFDDQPIEVNTDGLPSHVAGQVRKHAAESERSLMQYMWFTRRMHHLWIDDVTKPKDETVALDAPREKREYVVVRSHGNQ